MKDSQPYEIPKSYEKLSYKFILDELKDRHLEKVLDAASDGVTVEEPPSEKKSKEADAKIENSLQLPEGKKYFRIGEVSDLIGVESYVLRYWETEFKTVRPVKSKTGHRVYSANDVRALHLIRHLLHVEKFSVKGAKQKLLDLKRKPQAADPEATNKHRETLKGLLTELKQLSQIIRGNPGTL
jgi:DNA-binding transcriptional MerR regulator